MGILSKLKLDKHHKIERFGVFFMAMMFCMFILTGFIFYAKTVNDKVMLDTRAIYTTKFSSSLTNSSGVVHGIYRSADSTKALVLLKFNNVAGVSTNAEDYQAFLTGVQQRSGGGLARDILLNKPSGYILTFGSTGYMGVLLHDNTGFQNQIADLIIRANVMLVPVDEGSRSAQANRDASFSDFDQFQIYFNAGAADCEVSKALDGFEVNDVMVFNIYNELVSLPAEKEARDVLQADVDNMAVQLTAIADYEDRLLRTKPRGIVPDATPDYIRDDRVEYDDPMDKTTTRRLITNQVISGGFDFNWQDGSVAEGYLYDLSDGLSYADFILLKRSESGMRYNSNQVIWYQFEQSDPSAVTEYNPNQAVDTGSNATIRSNIELLKTAWNQYASTKQAYQTTHLSRLLVLEESVVDASQNYTINANDDVLRLY